MQNFKLSRPTGYWSLRVGFEENDLTPTAGLLGTISNLAPRRYGHGEVGLWMFHQIRHSTTLGDMKMAARKYMRRLICSG